MDDTRFSELVESVKEGAGMIALSSLIEKRGPMCEWCNARRATKRHHIFIGRMKGKPELDDERNLMLVCGQCHSSGKVSNRFAREWFWMVQSGRYPDFIQWYRGLDLKVKEFYVDSNE